MKKLFSSISLAFCTLSSMVLHGAQKNNEKDDSIEKSRSCDALIPLKNKKSRKKKKHARSQTIHNSIYMKKAKTGITKNDVMDIVEDEMEQYEELIDELKKEVNSLRKSIVNISENIMENSEQTLPNGMNVLDSAKELLEKTDDMNEEIGKLRNALDLHEEKLKKISKESKTRKKDNLLNNSKLIKGSLGLMAGAYALFKGNKHYNKQNKVKKGVDKKIIKK